MDFQVLIAAVMKCDYRADLINFHALYDPGMWHTVKGLLVVNPGCRQALFPGPTVFQYHLVSFY